MVDPYSGLLEVVRSLFVFNDSNFQNCLVPAGPGIYPELLYWEFGSHSSFFCSFSRRPGKGYPSW